MLQDFKHRIQSPAVPALDTLFGRDLDIRGPKNKNEEKGVGKKGG